MHRRANQHGEIAIQVCMAKVADERLHERYEESAFEHIEEMDKVLSTARTTFIQSKQFLPDLPLTYGWQEAFYDPVFVNNWFFWMQEPFRLTDKIFVCENQEKSGHLGYIVCYNNSYITRKIMHKVLQDDSPTTRPRRAIDRDNESNRFPRFESRCQAEETVDPGLHVVKPRCFIQTDNGPCCTMALFNFVANKGGSPTTKRILEGLSTDKSTAEKNMILKSLHHYVLCAGCNVHNECDQEPSVSDDHSTEGNHVILIIPFNGYVWEIDSAEHGDGALCLGKEGTEWTDVAQRRLERWTHAAWKSQHHNDVHAITAEKSAI
ncbi:hypothetical protein BGX28_009949 [Mortierella sp. GBA30]|nr:hypothetical protein BGX28_009949 [Mortierella sp. GBA30]